MFQFRRFPSYAYLIQRRMTEYCSAGFPHSVILGYNAYVRLPQAYRSLSRPSSAPDAKAFPLRSFQLDLVGASLPLLVLVLKNYADTITEDPSAFVAFTLLKFPQRAFFFCCLLSHFWNVFFVVQFSRCNL